jgi:hypothetical protein
MSWWHLAMMARHDVVQLWDVSLSAPYFTLCLEFAQGCLLALCPQLNWRPLDAAVAKLARHMGNLASISCLHLDISILPAPDDIYRELMCTRALEYISHVAPLGTAGIQGLEIICNQPGLRELRALGAAFGAGCKELSISIKKIQQPVRISS